MPIRLNKAQARKRITEIVSRHPSSICFSRHALEELKNDNLIVSDILNVIKSPAARIVGEGEYERGSFRYRLETNKIAIVIAFDSLISFVVITAWRKKL